MVLALFMVMAMSVLGTSLMFVSKTETLSSHNYRLMSQTRYGAESGVHVAANYLLSSAYTDVKPGSAGDPLSNYVFTSSPVTYNGAPVVLAYPSSASNYPISSVKTAFAALYASNVYGTLSVKDAPVKVAATATLMSMRQLTDSVTGQPIVVQTWELAGAGTVTGARDAAVSVSSLMEQQTAPVYSYAAFAQDKGCAALDFGGGATTNSYDSTAALSSGVPVLSNTFGNVGTNGNLKEVGSTTIIHGSLSTPRSGVGTCDDVQNVTALTQSGGATVDQGLIQLSQAITFPTPPAPNPLPPTTTSDFKQNSGCPAGAAYCAASADGATFTPPTSSSVVTLGNVVMNAQAIIHLNAGIYVVNSLLQNGNAQIIVDSGPVIINVAGVGQTTPVTINGGGLVNTAASGGYKPENLQLIYGGTGTVKLNGGSGTSALIYAPNAIGTISGGGDIYGAVIMKRISDTGGAAIHYDRNLNKSFVTAGNYVMTAFTWNSY